MSQDIIQQSKAMFDSPEKWNAFIELIKIKDSIRNEWTLNLKQQLDKECSTSNFTSKWGFKIFNNNSFQWFLNDYGENSISLWLEEGIFSLHNPDILQIDKIINLVNTEKFIPLVDCFDRIDIKNQGGYIFREERNFSFGSTYDTKFSFDILAWYAGNETNNFVVQILKKVNRFRMNENITNLIIELNQAMKI